MCHTPKWDKRMILQEFIYFEGPALTVIVAETLGAEILGTKR